MPFNSDTYHANKHWHEAWRELAEARKVKERLAGSYEYAFQREHDEWRLRNLCRNARWEMHHHLFHRRMMALNGKTWRRPDENWRPPSRRK